MELLLAVCSQSQLSLDQTDMVGRDLLYTYIRQGEAFLGNSCQGIMKNEYLAIQQIFLENILVILKSIS